MIGNVRASGTRGCYPGKRTTHGYHRRRIGADRAVGVDRAFFVDSKFRSVRFVAALDIAGQRNDGAGAGGLAGA